MPDDLLENARQQAEKANPSMRAAALLRIARAESAADVSRARRTLLEILDVICNLPSSVASSSSKKRAVSRRRYPLNCWLKSRFPRTNDLHPATSSLSCSLMVMLTRHSITFSITKTLRFHSLWSAMCFMSSIGSVPKVPIGGGCCFAVRSRRGNGPPLAVIITSAVVSCGFSGISGESSRQRKVSQSLV